MSAAVCNARVPFSPEANPPRQPYMSIMDRNGFQMGQGLKGNVSTGSEHESGSLYRRVMNDDQARDAYFNTTKGVLAGCRDDKDLDRAREILDKFHIAYCFTANASRPRPVFLMRDRVLVGARAIEAHFTKMATAGPT